MAAEEYVLGNVVELALLNEECVLHVACRMVGGKVELCEHMKVIVNLRTCCQREAHSLEDVYDLVCDNGQRMACAKRYRVGTACEVYVV